MKTLGGLPIIRKITSLRSLPPCERRRLKALKEIFREEGRIPLGTSRQEVKYLYRLEAGRKRYRWRKRPSISERMEWEETRREADPYSNRSIEEILTSLSGRRPEQDERSEK
jgi:hypothetical protein